MKENNTYYRKSIIMGIIGIVMVVIAIALYTSSMTFSSDGYALYIISAFTGLVLIDIGFSSPFEDEYYEEYYEEYYDEEEDS